MRAGPRFFEFATESRAFSGDVLKVSTTRGQKRSLGGRARSPEVPGATYLRRRVSEGGRNRVARGGPGVKGVAMEEGAAAGAFCALEGVLPSRAQPERVGGRRYALRGGQVEGGQIDPAGCPRCPSRARDKSARPRIKKKAVILFISRRRKGQRGQVRYFRDQFSTSYYLDVRGERAASISSRARRRRSSSFRARSAKRTWTSGFTFPLGDSFARNFGRISI